MLTDSYESVMNAGLFRLTRSLQLYPGIVFCELLRNGVANVNKCKDASGSFAAAFKDALESMHDHVDL